MVLQHTAPTVFMNERVAASDILNPVSLGDRIPFNQPGLSGEELQNIAVAVASHGSGDGPFTKRCRQPLHLSAMRRRWGGSQGQCPVTESVSDRLLRLPFYNSLTRVDQDRVIDAIAEFCSKDAPRTRTALA